MKINRFSSKSKLIMKFIYNIIRLWYSICVFFRGRGAIMAYLDDNNGNRYTQGDPLDELDKELAELKKTLTELDGNVEPERRDIADKPAEETSPSPSYPPDENSRSTEKDVKKAPEKEESMEKQTNKPRHSGGKGQNDKKRLSTTVAVIIIAALVTVAAAAAIGFGISRMAKPADEGSTTATSGGEVVTINDSVMGDVELQTVKGAEINTYSAENLVTENGFPAYYENGKKISHLGVDLSEFQGQVDFEKAKAAGIEFVMLRIGGRYYGDDGGMYDDAAFDNYYEQAKSAGLKVGAYFFSQAASAEDAKEEALYAIKKLNGKKLDYPIAFDWENIEDDKARTDNITGDELTIIAEAFCDTVINAGYRSIVYSNTSQMFVMYDFETMKDYDFWLADYREFPTMYYKYDMWQYATDGKIDGIEGNVDMNLSFTDFE